MTTVEITKEQFQKLAAAGFNHIPISRHIVADLETPLSIYSKFAKQPYSFLLESVAGGENWGRYSIIGLPCHTYLQVRDQTFSVVRNGQVEEEMTTDDPFAQVKTFFQRYRVPAMPDLPRFHGGLVGYFAYDTVRYVEKRLGPSRNPDPLQTPDIFLLLAEDLIVFDNLKHSLYLITYANPDEPNAYEEAQQRLEARINELSACNTMFIQPYASHPDIKSQEFSSNLTTAEFEQALKRIQQYILDGDVMQVVYSHRMQTPFQGEPLNLYRALRHLNPSPYLYFFNFGDFQVVGASPEVLVRVEDQQITVRPLAGTRQRGTTMAEDLKLEEELRTDPKENAEHLMLIDLGRNDVGRVSKTGSVQVPKKMEIERYSHVMHISSTVTGELKDELDSLDALKATLPAGTLSGAPKIRAMEIIDELERVKRGIYGGAVGYWAWNGNMDTAIALRTAVIKDQMLYLQVGAGIVADSNSKAEWKETQKKAAAMIQAATIAGKII